MYFQLNNHKEMESILIEILKVRNKRLYRQKKPLSTPGKGTETFEKVLINDCTEQRLPNLEHQINLSSIITNILVTAYDSKLSYEIKPMPCIKIYMEKNLQLHSNVVMDG